MLRKHEQTKQEIDAPDICAVKHPLPMKQEKENRVEMIDVYYIRPNRSIEIVEVINGNTKIVVYIYNYEGYYFRLFTDIMQLIEFFNNGTEPPIDFETDEDLDNFLEKMNIFDIQSNRCFLTCCE